MVIFCVPPRPSHAPHGEGRRYVGGGSRLTGGFQLAYPLCVHPSTVRPPVHLSFARPPSVVRRRSAPSFCAHPSVIQPIRRSSTHYRPSTVLRPFICSLRPSAILLCPSVCRPAYPSFICHPFILHPFICSFASVRRPSPVVGPPSVLLLPICLSSVDPLLRQVSPLSP